MQHTDTHFRIDDLGIHQVQIISRLITDASELPVPAGDTIVADHGFTLRLIDPCNNKTLELRETVLVIKPPHLWTIACVLPYMYITGYWTPTEDGSQLCYDPYPGPGKIYGRVKANVPVYYAYTLRDVNSSHGRQVFLWTTMDLCQRHGHSIPDALLGDTQLHATRAAPFPNIHDDGHACLSSVSCAILSHTKRDGIITTFENIIASELESENNADLHSWRGRFQRQPTEEGEEDILHFNWRNFPALGLPGEVDAITKLIHPTT